MTAVAVATPSVDDSGPLSMEPAASGALTVLRVLSGVHLGAEVPVRTERLLVGNLEAECDLVLDVGRPERHACLLRISADGWTVLPISGDLWVGTDYVPTQQTRSFAAGVPITLGRIAFAVGDAVTTPWDTVRPPLELVRPEADGPMPMVASLGTRPQMLLGWKATRLAAGLGVGALVVAASVGYVVNVLQAQVPREVESARRLEAARGALAVLPIASEVKVVPDPDEPGRLQLRGYVAEGEHIRAIEQALQGSRAPLTWRLQTVPALTAELSRRLPSVARASVRYLGNGAFAADAESAHLAALDLPLRTALQELPAVASMRIVVTDLREDDGSSAHVTYRRAPERVSDIVVDGADLVGRTRRAYLVREVRLGALPSVLFVDGGHYFVGGRLPDGWIIDRVAAESVTLRLGSKERVLRLSSPGAQGK